MKAYPAVFLSIRVLLVMCSAFAFAADPDPAGTKTGTAADVIGATPGAPTADDMKKLSPNEPLAASSILQVPRSCT